MAINVTAVWRVRAAGSNTNGGGYDAAISGAATDYSQQNSAQASGTHGTSSNTTTFVDSTANAFTSAMVGNAIWINSGGGTIGAYFVTAFTSASTVTIDRAPGTVASGAWALGGAWADFWTNPVVASTPVVGGNIVYIRGAGTDTPSTADYSPTSLLLNGLNGSSTTGYISFIGENGRPRIALGGMIYQFAYLRFQHLYIQAVTGCFSNTVGGGPGSNALFFANNAFSSVMYDCVVDQNGFNIAVNINSSFHFHTCEFFSSVSTGAGTSNDYAIRISGTGHNINNCFIHDTMGPGAALSQYGDGVFNTIFANCGGTGITVTSSEAGTEDRHSISNCTFSGNGGAGGVSMSTNVDWIMDTAITNCIFANHSGGSQAGITISFGTTAVNTALVGLIENNQFYNNTTHGSGFTLTASNTISNPTFAAGTENYLPTTAIPAITFPINRLAGMTTTVNSAVVGPAQPAAGPGGGVVFVISSADQPLWGKSAMISY